MAPATNPGDDQLLFLIGRAIFMSPGITCLAHGTPFTSIFFDPRHTDHHHFGVCLFRAILSRGRGEILRSGQLVRLYWLKKSHNLFNIDMIAVYISALKGHVGMFKESGFRNFGEVRTTNSSKYPTEDTSYSTSQPSLHRHLLLDLGIAIPI